MFIGGQVFAADDTPQSRLQEADRYIAVVPPKELFADMAEQIAKTVPQEQRQALKDSLTTNLDIDALTKAMRDSMVKNFTTDELKALGDFYGSPVGKSAMKKMGVYMADLMPTIQAEIMKSLAKTKAQQPGAAAHQ